MSTATSEQGYNSFLNIDDLPLTTDQKEMVLEWFAQKIWRGLDEPDHCKSYDPLLIEGSTAHSYVFNLRDGGRHHAFEDLAELEELLIEEMRMYALFYADQVGAHDALKDGSGVSEDTMPTDVETKAK